MLLLDRCWLYGIFIVTEILDLYICRMSKPTEDKRVITKRECDKQEERQDTNNQDE